MKVNPRERPSGRSSVEKERSTAESKNPTKPPSLDPYFARLERFELFSTNQCYYLVGCNKQNTAYRVLKMDRTMLERQNKNNSNNADPGHLRPRHRDETGRNIAEGSNETESAQMSDHSHAAKPSMRPLSDFLTEDPNVYSQEEIKDVLGALLLLFVITLLTALLISFLSNQI